MYICYFRCVFLSLASPVTAVACVPLPPAVANVPDVAAVERAPAVAGFTANPCLLTTVHDVATFPTVAVTLIP